VDDVCLRAGDGRVVAAANINSPRQIVIAGHRDAVDRALKLAKESGARRAILLPVSAPFHCCLMRPAETRLAEDLDSIGFGDLKFPLITNAEARPVREGEEARRALKLQVSRPVRWHATIRLLLDEGVDTFVEVGPGKVLTGLVRSVEKSVTMLNAEDERSLDQTLAALL
jgi:[acyl-carrier-protein] S-malonyltransferase